VPGQLHVVVKHEAQAVRKARQQFVASEEIDLDARAADGVPDADERVLRFDRLARSAEALSRLKPQEVRALWLKAQGHSYQEIAASEGWTYTKVNRCITEGRRAFLDRYAGIEAGEECRRWAPVVSAMVDGEATAEQIAAARPHLRRCAGCRATVRELHAAGPGLAGVLPVAGLAGVPAATGSGGPLDSLARAAEGVVVAVHERASAWALKLQMATEAASATKVAAVAASAAAIAGGGAVTAHEATGRDEPIKAAQVAAGVPVSEAGATLTPAVVGPPTAPAATEPGGGSASAQPDGAPAEFSVEAEPEAVASSGEFSPEPEAAPEPAPDAAAESAPEPERAADPVGRSPAAPIAAPAPPPPAPAPTAASVVERPQRPAATTSEFGVE
jgi:hypothetical protein